MVPGEERKKTCLVIPVFFFKGLIQEKSVSILFLPSDFKNELNKTGPILGGWGSLIEYRFRFCGF